MESKLSGLLLLQMLVLFISSLVMYFITPYVLDQSLINLALGFAAITFIYFIYIRYSIGISKNSFSLSLLFVLSFIIVFFQIPLDFLFRSFVNSALYNSYIYDESILVKSVWYAVIFFIVMCLGMHFQAIKIHNNKFKKKPVGIFYSVYEKPYFYLFYLLFFLHLVTINPSYYRGNVSNDDLSGLAGSIHGYFIIIMPICFAVTVYNYKIKNYMVPLGFLGYIKLFPLFFLAIIILFSSMSFLVGDRGPAIRALILLVGGYYITTNKKVTYFQFFLMIVIAGFFLSTIKLIGAINYNEDLIASFLSASDRLGEKDRIVSISPYTAELAGSFRAYNIGFSLWNSGHSLYGMGLITGILMSIPYSVTIFMEAFGLGKTDINTSFTITRYVSESYGLGTTIIGDSLLNIGFIPTLVLAFFIGRVFINFDYQFFIKPSSVYSYAIGFLLLMTSVNLARGSIFPLLGNAIFILVTIFVISAFSKRLGNKL